MRSRLLVLIVLTGSFAGSTALASVAVSSHKKPATGPGCKPAVTVVLQGTVATAPGSSPTLPFTLAVRVTHANGHGRAYVKASQPVSVTVTAATKIRRQGAKTLSALLAGDRVMIHARSCKADLAKGAAPALTATMVVAHPAAAGHSGGSDSDDDSGS